jgi:hypothetical protein
MSTALMGKSVRLFASNHRANVVGRSLGQCDLDGDSTKCCGLNSYFPVYINPELEGCYVPSIPGYGLLDSDDLPTAFVCADVPASLTAGPSFYTPVLGAYDNLLQITSTDLPIHPVSVSPHGNDEGNYFEYGCFQGAPDVILTANFAVGTPAGDTDLKTCAVACTELSASFFAVTGGDSCFCGDAVLRRHQSGSTHATSGAAATPSNSAVATDIPRCMPSPDNGQTPLPLGSNVCWPPPTLLSMSARPQAGLPLAVTLLQPKPVLPRARLPRRRALPRARLLHIQQPAHRRLSPLLNHLQRTRISSVFVSSGVTFRLLASARLLLVTTVASLAVLDP